MFSGCRGTCSVDQAGASTSQRCTCLWLLSAGIEVMCYQHLAYHSLEVFLGVLRNARRQKLTNRETRIFVNNCLAFVLQFEICVPGLHCWIDCWISQSGDEKALNADGERNSSQVVLFLQSERIIFYATGLQGFLTHYFRVCQYKAYCEMLSD